MDLDDLLEEELAPTIAKKNTSVSGKRPSSLVTSKYGRGGMNSNDDDLDLDDIDDTLGFGKPKSSYSKPAAGLTGGAISGGIGGGLGTRSKTQAKVSEPEGNWWGGGYQAPASRKSRQSQEDEGDEIDAMLNEYDPPKEEKKTNISFNRPMTGNANNQSSGRLNYSNANKEDDDPTGGWGVTSARKSNYSGGFGGNRPNQDEDDDVDGILDELEDKKGLGRPKTAGPLARQETNWTAGGGRNAGTYSNFDQQNDLDDLDDLEDGLEGESKVSNSNQKSSADAMQQRRAALFGGAGGSNQNQNSNSRLGSAGPQLKNSKTMGNSTRNFKQNHTQEDAPQDQLNRKAPNQTSGPLNPSFQGTTLSGQGSQDSGIEVIETAFSRAKPQRRVMQRPPTSSGVNNAQADSTGPSANMLQRPHTGPAGNQAARPPIPQHQSLGSPQFDGGSDDLSTVNAGNFNFQPRTVQQQNAAAGGPQMFGTNFLSEADFERANTDVEDNEEEESYYTEEEVTIEDEPTDDDFKTGGLLDDDDDKEDDSENSDLGFYNPTILPSRSKTSLGIGGQSNSGGKKATKAKKTKKVKKKKKKISPKKPPKGVRQVNAVGAGPQDPLRLDNQRKSQTLSQDKDKNTMQIPKTTSQPLMRAAMQSTFSNPGSAVTPSVNLHAMDEKQILEYESGQEKQKLKLKEQEHRQTMDSIRKQHQQQLEAFHRQQAENIKQIEVEKTKLIEDRTKVIELEKSKLGQLHKIDQDQRQSAHLKVVEEQKSLFEEQHDSLRKQLQQKVQMNSLAEEISKSSGSINSLVHKMSAEQEGELRRREDEINAREAALAERRRQLNDKKLKIEQRKRKLASEFEEVAQRERETTAEYETEKQEITASIDDKDMESQHVNREIRNRAIDTEVEVRRVMSEVERLQQGRDRDTVEGTEKIEEIEIELKQIKMSRYAFRQEMEQTEQELRKKLLKVEQQAQEHSRYENEFQMREAEFEDEHRQVMAQNEVLQEQVESFQIQKDNFDRRALKVKEQGELDQIDSEKIGFFKANKERIADELKRLKIGLEEEKQTLTEDRVKLEIYKNEMKTKQKAIESMRYEYIKVTSNENIMHFADQAKDLGLYKLAKEAAGGGENYPMYPLSHRPAPAAATSAAGTRKAAQGANGKFNYNEYMKNLNDKLTVTAPNSGSLVGTGFQEFILKERQSYMKAVNSYEGTSLLR